MSVLFYNIQGLRGKVSQLEAFLIDSPAHVLCINEHWLYRDEMDVLNITGLKHASSYCRTIHRLGGVAIFTDPRLKIEPLQHEVEDFCDELNFEVTGVVCHNIQMLTIYRSPSGNFDIYLSKLSSMLDRVNIRKPIVVTGDFNVHFELGTDEAESLTELFGSYGLARVVTGPTRGRACLDAIFTNIDINLCLGGIIDLDMSDHQAVFCKLKTCDFSAAFSKRIIYRPVTEMGLFRLYTHILDSDWSFINDADLDCNKKFELFTEVLANACDISFPEKSRLLDAKCNAQRVHWFNDELRQMRETLRLLTRMKKAGNTAVSDGCLRWYRRHYRDALDRHKKVANENYINTSSNRSKAVWEIIRSNNPTKKKSTTEALHANDFNNFFTSIAENIIQSLPVTQSDPLDYLKSFMSGRSPGSFCFKEVSFTDVRDIISSMKNSSSKDCYHLNARIIKTIKHIIVVPLTKLINQCIRSNMFPDCLKVARVVPVFKKGLDDDLNNYRPISVIPILGKIFEAALKQQLTNHLERSNLLNSSQFGFRSNLSTTVAIGHLSRFVQRCFEEKSYALASFFDLSKAFDCVSHDLLTLKLQEYNISDESVALIASYLLHRKQFVTYNMNRSDIGCIGYGVPQGSVLGPVLFLMYINDVSTCIPRGQDLILFADDTTALDASSDLERLGRQVMDTQSRIRDWFTSNRLGVNNSKTQSLCFSLRPCESNRNPVKFLGVYLDSKLTWEIHCSKLASRLSKNIYIIRNLKSIVSTKVLLNAYYGHIYTHMAYAVLCWGHSSHASRVFAVQRRCLRVMAGLKYDQCCRQAFIHLGILTFPCVYIINCLKHIRAHISDYSRPRDVHGHNTRTRENFIFDYTRTGRARDGSNYYAVKFYNVLPATIKDLDDDNFVRKVVNFLKNKAFYSTDEYMEHDFLDLI